MVFFSLPRGDVAQRKRGILKHFYALPKGDVALRQRGIIKHFYAPPRGDVAQRQRVFSNISMPLPGEMSR